MLVVDIATFPQNLALIRFVHGFWQNVFYRRTTMTEDDGRPRHGISSVGSQAELKAVAKVQSVQEQAKQRSMVNGVRLKLSPCTRIAVQAPC